MKKIILFIFGFIAFSVQAQTLTINNPNPWPIPSDDCDVEIIFYAIDPTTCTVLETSNTFFVGGNGGVLTFSYSDLTAIPSSVWSSGNAPAGVFEIGYAEVFSVSACARLGGVPGSCTLDQTTVGDINCGYNNFGCFVKTPLSTCGGCPAGQAVNVNYNSPGTWGTGINVDIQIQ